MFNVDGDSNLANMGTFDWVSDPPVFHLGGVEGQLRQAGKVRRDEMAFFAISPGFRIVGSLVQQ